MRWKIQKSALGTGSFVTSGIKKGGFHVHMFRAGGFVGWLVVFCMEGNATRFSRISQ